MLLFYIRHGDPIYNPDGLTELGKRQAQALVQRMKLCNPDKIFASSSNRAIMTANPTAEYLKKDIQILDWCNERHVAKEFIVNTDNGGRAWCFHYDKYRKIFASAEVQALGKKWYEHEMFASLRFAEGVKRVQQEVDKFIRELGYLHDSENNVYIPERQNEDRIALFAHQGFGMIFLSCLLDIPYPQIALHFDHGHSEMTVIEWKGNDFVIPRVLQMSNDSHIFAAGISTNYQNEILF